MDWIERLNRAPARLPLAPGLERATAEVLHWAYQPHLNDNQPHRHTYFEVCLVGAYGAGRFIVEDRPYTIGPGDLFIARPGVVHQIVNTQNPLMELYWVSFQWEPGQGSETGVAALLHRFTEAGDVLVVHDTGGHLLSLWQALRAIAGPQGQGPAQDAQIAALSGALLLGILQAGAGEESAVAAPRPSDTGASLARLAVRYIHDNLNRPLSVAEVADYLHLSTRHLTRLITRFTGVSPAAYIEQARMDRARTLLSRSDSAIKQVAQQVGYRDVHHFTRAFTRSIGVSPGRFRQEGGGGSRRGAPKPGALV